MAGIVKIIYTSASAVPKDSCETCVSGTRVFPVRGTLPGNATENLIDHTRMRYDQYLLSRMDASDACYGSQHTFSKSAVTFSTGPGHLFIGLILIPAPNFGILVSHLTDRQPVHNPAIDFSKRVQYSKRANERRCRSGCLKSASERARVQNIGERLGLEALSQQGNLEQASRGERYIISPAQKRGAVFRAVHGSMSHK